MPELILNKFKNANGYYDKSSKHWVLNLETYKDVSHFVFLFYLKLQVNNYFKGKQVKVTEIPDFVFFLIDNPVPFNETSFKKLINYDYNNDYKVKYL